MTRSQLTHALLCWQSTCTDMCREWSALAACTDAGFDSKLGRAVAVLMDRYTDAVVDALGIPPSGCEAFKHDLDWYANENDYGAKGLDVTVNKRRRAIRSPADLAWLVGSTIKGAKP